jgi:hypothetical protein
MLAAPISWRISNSGLPIAPVDTAGIGVGLALLF